MEPVTLIDLLSESLQVHSSNVKLSRPVPSNKNEKRESSTWKPGFLEVVKGRGQL